MNRKQELDSSKYKGMDYITEKQARNKDNERKLIKGHNISTLPKWAQGHINELEYEIRHRESLKQLHAVLSEPNRDWFTLPDPVGGCHEELLHLWILDKDHPFSICSLGKGDMLFVGRAIKEK